MKVSFIQWINATTCKNYPIGRYGNQSIYELPIPGLHLMETEYVPFNPFKPITTHVILGGLFLDDKPEIVALLAKYNGFLSEAIYSNDKMIGKFDTLENAFEFVNNHYDEIYEAFKTSLV